MRDESDVIRHVVRDGGGLRVENPKTLRIGLSKVYCCSNIDLPYSVSTLPYFYGLKLSFIS